MVFTRKMLSLQRRRRIMRRGHRSLDAELGISTFMALQRLKQFEQIEIKDREKDLYRSLQSMVKKMFYACCGKRKTMIYLLNYLERIKSLDKLKCASLPLREVSSRISERWQTRISVGTA